MKRDVYFVSLFVTGLIAGVLQSYAGASPWTTALLIPVLYGLYKLRTVLRQALAVFFFALAFLLGSDFWLGLAIYHPPVNTLPMALTLTCLLLAGQALVHALIFLGTRAATGRAGASGLTGLAFSAGLSWGLAEVVRSVGWWAMPWGLLGHGQLDNPLLRGLYPLIGSHGVAAAMWLLAAFGLAVLRLTFRTFSLRRATFVAGSVTVTEGPRALFRILFSTFLLLFLYFSQFATWTQPAGPPLAIRIVHTDLPGEDKQTEVVQLAAIASLRQTASTGGADLTVFPELFLVHAPSAIDAQVRQDIVDASRRTQTSLVFGSLLGARDSGGALRHQNALIQIGADGNTQVYAKELLLPFSEFLPETVMLRWAYPYLYRYPQANLVGGLADQPAVRVRGVPLGLTICSELAYAGKAARQARDAQILVNASNDGWVPSDAYLRQAHQIARVRAAEAQKPMVRSNNVGFSAFIDYRGDVMSSLVGQPGSGIMDVTPRTGVTPFVAMADWVARL